MPGHLRARVFFRKELRQMALLTSCRLCVYSVVRGNLNMLKLPFVHILKASKTVLIDKDEYLMVFCKFRWIFLFFS